MSSTPSAPSRHPPGDTFPSPEPRQPQGRGIGPLALLLALALTGGYLAGPARLRMDAGTTGILLMHLGLGALAALVFLWLSVRSCLSQSWKRSRSSDGRPADQWRSPLAWVLALITLSTGLGLIVIAARGQVAGGSHGRRSDQQAEQEQAYGHGKTRRNDAHSE
jgi:hypothetical protein